jgi:hypothetical protein
VTEAVFVGVTLAVGVTEDVGVTEAVGVYVGVTDGVGVTDAVGVGVGVGAMKITSTGHIQAEVSTLVTPQLLITSPGGRIELKLYST